MKTKVKTFVLDINNNIDDYLSLPTVRAWILCVDLKDEDIVNIVTTPCSNKLLLTIIYRKEDN